MIPGKRKVYATFLRAIDLLSDPALKSYRVCVGTSCSTPDAFPEDEFVVAKITPDAPKEIENSLLALQDEVPLIVIRQANFDHAQNLFSGDFTASRNKNLPWVM
jgi:hypothetical protein